jgi:hypothetical protein
MTTLKQLVLTFFVVASLATAASACCDELQSVMTSCGGGVGCHVISIQVCKNQGTGNIFADGAGAL